MQVAKPCSAFSEIPFPLKPRPSKFLHSTDAQAYPVTTKFQPSTLLSTNAVTFYCSAYSVILYMVEISMCSRTLARRYYGWILNALGFSWYDIRTAHTSAIPRSGA